MLVHNLRWGWKLSALALASALTLAACGGGDDDNNNDDNNPLGITAVKVFGDSLSDSGTFQGLPGFGRTFTVQGTRNEPTVLWVEHVTAAYALAAQCPVYKFNGTTFTRNSKAGCTNYAVGGGRINNPVSGGGSAAPLSILRQLEDGATAGWAKTDLLLVDGGGNDAADVVSAYLGSAQDRGVAYTALLSTLIPAQTLATVLAGANGPETAAVLYMQALADKFAATLRTQALDKGAQHVVVANMPGITYTPRFQAVLDAIAAAAGGGTAGAAARTQAESLFQSWVGAFNQRLAAAFASDQRVRVVDIAGRLADQMARPAAYGVTNVTLPVCGGDGITVVPKREFVDCTAAALSATPPPPGAPNGTAWWERYYFADGFHPTPYGHALVADQVIDLLDDADWL